MHAGYDPTAEAILLCESDGTPKRWKKKSPHERSAARRAPPPSA